MLLILHRMSSSEPSQSRLRVGVVDLQKVSHHAFAASAVEHLEITHRARCTSDESWGWATGGEVCSTVGVVSRMGCLACPSRRDFQSLSALVLSQRSIFSRSACDTPGVIGVRKLNWSDQRLLC